MAAVLAWGAVWGAAVPAGEDPCQVILLGTIHGMHGQNKQYSLDALRDLIETLKPAEILIELPPMIDGRPTMEEGRVDKALAGNENAAANAAAKALRIPIFPYDRDGRNEFYRKTKYFERQKELSRKVGAWLEVATNGSQAPAEAALLGPLLGNVSRSQEYFMSSTGPAIINSEGFDRIIRTKHMMWDELMPELAARLDSLREMASEFAFFRDEWRERNEIMAKNIIARARQLRGRRIVVLCGCEHRYMLRDLLASEAGVRIHEYFDVPANRP
jgi:pheromone shutdown protein TraB